MKKTSKKSTSDLIIKISTIYLIMIYGCCTPSLELSDYKQAESLAKEKYGTGFEIVKNEHEAMMLCYKEDKKRSQPHSTLSYFVYDLNKKEIIFEEKLFDADIKWLDAHNIEIRITPEVISSDDDVTVFILNVLTKEKQKSNFNNE